MTVLLISFIRVIDIYIFIIVASAIMSWFQPNPYNPIVQFVHKITTPVYDFIRRLIPTTFGMIDIAPIITILILMLTQNILAQIVANAI